MKKNWSMVLLFLVFNWQMSSGNFSEIDGCSLFGIQSKDLRLESFFNFRPGRTKKYISVLTNNKHNRFVFKQKISNSLVFAIEKLGADIARSVGIYANQIRIIPANIPFIGKKEIGLPATLHTFVPGVQVRYLPKNLHQYLVDLKQCKIKREKKFGFSRELIKNMSLHEDLPNIVALDTFLANYDRHKSNFFYDKDSDHFFIIDFGASFCMNLAETVYLFFLTMLEDENAQLSFEEVRGLVVYRNMLERLITKYSIGILIAKFDKLIKQAQLNINNNNLFEKLKSRERIIKNMLANYNSCIKVVHVLDVLIKRWSIKWGS